MPRSDHTACSSLYDRLKSSDVNSDLLFFGGWGRTTESRRSRARSVGTKCRGERLEGCALPSFGVRELWCRKSLKFCMQICTFWCFSCVVCLGQQYQAKILKWPKDALTPVFLFGGKRPPRPQDRCQCKKDVHVSVYVMSAGGTWRTAGRSEGAHRQLSASDQWRWRWGLHGDALRRQVQPCIRHGGSLRRRGRWVRSQTNTDVF